MVVFLFCFTLAFFTSVFDWHCSSLNMQFWNNMLRLFWYSPHGWLGIKNKLSIIIIIIIINIYKCISNVPNPSMTIHVWGSKHYTWNTATIHILIMPLLCIHPRGARTHAHPHTHTHNIHTYLFICHSTDRCSQNRPSVESTELERKRKKEKEKNNSVVESRGWETLFLLIIMTSPHCLSFSRESRRQRFCGASSVSEQTLVKWCAMCWSSIRRSQHLSVKIHGSLSVVLILHSANIFCHLSAEEWSSKPTKWRIQ